MLHGRIASALEKHGIADPDLLAGHWHAAGAKQKTFHYAVKAAEAAVRTLAFERGVVLYRMALEQISPAHPEHANVSKALDEAAAWAGKCVLAGEVCLAAVLAAVRKSW
jgi:hypothetical protein